MSLWIRDMPRPAHLSPEESHKRAVVGLRQHWERKHAYREEFRTAASREIGQLTDRETIIAGAIAYWCEGSKTKPWRTAGARVTFINSDPSLIRFFLRFLDIAGIERTDLVFRVQIHESADVAAAERFWKEQTGAPEDQFRFFLALRQLMPSRQRDGHHDGHDAHRHQECNHRITVLTL